MLKRDGNDEVFIIDHTTESNNVGIQNQAKSWHMAYDSYDLCESIVFIELFGLGTRFPGIRFSLHDAMKMVAKRSFLVFLIIWGLTFDWKPPWAFTTPRSRLLVGVGFGRNLTPRLLKQR